MKHLNVLCLCVWIAKTIAFEVPEALVEPLSPKGLRVSIPDVPGIKLFAFHGKINEDFDAKEGGTLSKDIIRPKNGRWTFSDKNVRLKVGDTLYYWTYVIYEDNLGYENLFNNFTVRELIGASQPPDNPNSGSSGNRPPSPPPVTPQQCELSRTTVNGNRVCVRQLIFEDNFNAIDNNKWNTEIKFANEPDYEFVIYEKDPAVLYAQTDYLHIKPTLTESKHGEEAVNLPLDLGLQCSGIPGTDQCSKTPASFLILPPVISGQVTTKQKFSFLYGEVEIRAKLPKGDWLYPQLYLQPSRNAYGSNYESGQIRIAFAPGNSDLGNELSGGVILGSSIAGRSFGIRRSHAANLWSNEFHTYKLKWTPGMSEKEKWNFISAPWG